MRILILDSEGQYGVLHAFSASLNKELQHQSVDSVLFSPQQETPEQLLGLLTDLKPDIMLTFNGYFTDAAGLLPCDYMHTPQLFWLVDHPSHFSYAISPFAHLCCVDKGHADYIARLGHPSVTFLPHAVDDDIFFYGETTRDIDCAFFGSYIDIDAIRQEWLELPKSLAEAMDSAAESEDMALGMVSGGIRLSIEEMMQLTSLLDLYRKGRERIKLLQSIKRLPVSIFGAGWDTPSCRAHFSQQKNLHFLHGITYKESCDIMRRVKLALHSCPSIHDGLHERILGALACGAMPVARGTSYLEAAFDATKSVVWWQPDDLNALESELCNLLANEEERTARTRAGQGRVHAEHTWQHRSKQLLDRIGNICASE